MITPDECSRTPESRHHNGLVSLTLHQLIAIMQNGPSLARQTTAITREYGAPARIRVIVWNRCTSPSLVNADFRASFYAVL
jgi:hypothetical protein